MIVPAVGLLPFLPPLPPLPPQYPRALPAPSVRLRVRTCGVRAARPRRPCRHRLIMLYPGVLLSSQSRWTCHVTSKINDVGMGLLAPLSVIIFPRTLPLHPRSAGRLRVSQTCHGLAHAGCVTPSRPLYKSMGRCVVKAMIGCSSVSSANPA